MKKGILGGIIASIVFTILVQPILGTVWNFLNISFLSFTDGLYANAALGRRNWIDFIVFTFILLIIINSIILGVFILSKKVDNLSNVNKNEPAEKTKISELKYKINKAKRRIRIYLRLIYYILIPILLVMSSGLMLKSFVDLQLNTSFNQRLNTIAPYIDENEEEKLKSKWALMKNKADFEEIDNSIEGIAKKNKITLPKNLLE